MLSNPLKIFFAIPEPQIPTVEIISINYVGVAASFSTLSRAQTLGECGTLPMTFFLYSLNQKKSEVREGVLKLYTRLWI